MAPDHKRHCRTMTCRRILICMTLYTHALTWTVQLQSVPELCMTTGAAGLHSALSINRD